MMAPVCICIIIQGTIIIQAATIIIQGTIIIQAAAIATIIIIIQGTIILCRAASWAYLTILFDAVSAGKRQTKGPARPMLVKVPLCHSVPLWHSH